MEFFSLRLFFIILFYSKYCCGIRIVDCGSSRGRLHDLTFSGCLNNNDEVCQVEKGTNGVLTVKFSPAEDVYDLTMKACALFRGMRIKLSLPKPDLCSDLLKCPLSAYSNQTYTTNLVIPDRIPKLKADVKWEILNESMDDVVCAQFPVQVL